MRPRRSRGFTLIEMFVVLLIVAVLALLAMAGYQKFVRSTYLAEAQNMVSNIRSAEDAFRAENGGYLNVSQALGPTHDYPAATPGAFKTSWGAPCDTAAVCKSATSWQALGVQSNAPVTYGYSVIADNTGTAAPPSTAVMVNNAYISLAAMTGGPWYIVEADGDPKGTGKWTKLFGMSGTNQIFINGDNQ